MQGKKIISIAENIKLLYNTNNPYEIAEYLGIVVLHRENTIKDFTAQTIKIEGYPTIISINNAYTESSKKLLCAHELGHALLHENCINHFATTNQNITTNLEHEANLFALALLMDEKFVDDLPLPLSQMNNYLLKSIMDYNINLKD